MLAVWCASDDALWTREQGISVSRWSGTTRRWNCPDVMMIQKYGVLGLDRCKGKRRGDLEVDGRNQDPKERQKMAFIYGYYRRCVFFLYLDAMVLAGSWTWI